MKFKWYQLLLYSTIYKAFFIALAMITPLTLLARDGNPDFMRSMGKMYVVVGVIVIIFLGLVYYIVKLDKRLKNIENQINRK